MLALGLSPGRVLALGGLVYALLLVAQLPAGRDAVGWSRTPAYLALVAAMNLITLLGVQLGIASGLRRRLLPGGR